MSRRDARKRRNTAAAEPATAEPRANVIEPASVEDEAGAHVEDATPTALVEETPTAPEEETPTAPEEETPTALVEETPTALVEETADLAIGLDAIHATLAELAADGANDFDPVGLTMVAHLLARAGEREGAARARLARRAAAGVATIAANFAHARDRASAIASSDAERAIARTGDVAAVVRAARRARAASEYARAGESRWAARTIARASEEAIAHPAASPHALAAALYDRARADVDAALTVTRAADDASASAGPYNPRALAARVLAEIADLSPRYLRAQIERLARLGVLLDATAAAGATPARPRPRRR
jgi:hypothetical protein